MSKLVRDALLRLSVRFIVALTALLAPAVATARVAEPVFDLVLAADAAGDPEDVAARAASGMPHTLFLNFSDGTESLTRAPFDRARDNLSAIGNAAPFPEFKWRAFTTLGSTRAEVVAAVARRVNQAFLSYNLVLTTVRPSSGPYAMVFIGGGPELFDLPSYVAGVALLDCGNRQSGNVVFAFPNAISGSAQTLFVTIAQEAAHAYGLEHTNNPADLMYPKASPTQTSFPDVTSAIVGEPSCGFSTQNSHERLLALLGGWSGGDKPVQDGAREDLGPPSVEILEPAPDGHVGADFRVRASAHDDTGVARVALSIGALGAVATGPPFEWQVSHLPEGPVVIRVTAYDEVGNSETATRVVTVEGSAGEPGGCRVAQRSPGGTLAAALAACALTGVRRRGRRV